MTTFQDQRSIISCCNIDQAAHIMTEVLVTTGAIRHAKFQSNRHHQQTNTLFFYRRMPFLSPN